MPRIMVHLRSVRMGASWPLARQLRISCHRTPMRPLMSSSMTAAWRPPPESVSIARAKKAMLVVALYLPSARMGASWPLARRPPTLSRRTPMELTIFSFMTVRQGARPESVLIASIRRVMPYFWSSCPQCGWALRGF